MPRLDRSRLPVPPLAAPGLTGGLVLAGLVALVVLVGGACGPDGGDDAPVSLAGTVAGRNVLLLTVDTVRADRLGAWGHERAEVESVSPRIDALVASGARFEHAVAPRSITWPSLASVLTGLYPSGHGVIENGYELADGAEALPLRFRDAGYATGAFLSNMCRANHQGWDALACSGGEDGKTIDRALGWVREVEAAGDGPWFLWVHLFAAHGPYYNGGDRAATRLDPGYEGPVGPKKWMLDRIMNEDIPLDERDIRHLDALYDAAILGTDGLVGRLLDGLDLGVAGSPGRQEALIVFLSDHGEDLYDHNGYLYHACSPYQTSLHVPLAVVAEGALPEGLVVPQLVELIDVAPTVLELAGMVALEESHGVSLTRLLGRHAGGSGPEGLGSKPAFSEYSGLPIHTVQEGPWKLVWNPEEIEPFCIPGADPGHYPLERAELYDLSRDPGETVDLAARHPERVRALAERIRLRFAGLDAERQELDPQLREELEALGYVAN